MITPYIGAADYFVLLGNFKVESATANIHIGSSGMTGHDSLIGIRAVWRFAKSVFGFSVTRLDNLNGGEMPLVYQFEGAGFIAGRGGPYGSGNRLEMNGEVSLFENGKLKLGGFVYNRGDYRQRGGSAQLTISM